MTTQVEALKVRHAFENIRNNYVGWQDNDNFKVLEDALAALATVSDAQPIERRVMEVVVSGTPVLVEVQSDMPLTSIQELAWRGAGVSITSGEWIFTDESGQVLDDSKGIFNVGSARIFLSRSAGIAAASAPSPSAVSAQPISEEQIRKLRLLTEKTDGDDSVHGRFVRFTRAVERALSAQPAQPISSDAQPVSYMARRWCTGDNAWSEWRPESAEFYERTRDDRTFEFRALASPAPDVWPIDMILHCPACGVQHIDAPEQWFDESRMNKPAWDNPRHRSHLCHGCGHIWRPADVPTNGVAEIKTRGKADSVTADVPPCAPPITDQYILQRAEHHMFGEDQKGTLTECPESGQKIIGLVREFIGRPSVPVSDEQIKPRDGWAVHVEVDGERILSIESECLSGAPDIDRYADTVRNCAQHLLSFVGNGEPSEFFPPDDAPVASQRAAPVQQEPVCKACEGEGVIFVDTCMVPCVTCQAVSDDSAAPAVQAVPSVPDVRQVAISDKFIDRLILAICEIPDRNSPEDFPDGMVVTAKELRENIRGIEERFAEQEESILAAPSVRSTPLPPPIFSQEHSDAMYRAGMIQAGKMPQPSAPSVSAGAKDAQRPVIREIAAERERQVSAEGWTEAHDDEHSDRSLAQAAFSYVKHYVGRAWVLDQHDGLWIYRGEAAPFEWPDSWCTTWWKPKHPRRDLIRAAALLAAEIERIDRAAIAGQSKEPKGASE